MLQWNSQGSHLDYLVYFKTNYESDKYFLRGAHSCSVNATQLEPRLALYSQEVTNPVPVCWSTTLVQIELYLNNYWTDGLKILYRQRLSVIPLLFVKRHEGLPYSRMKCDNFGDPLIFHLAPSSGEDLNFSSALVSDQIPAKADDAPSAVLCVWR